MTKTGEALIYTHILALHKATVVFMSLLVKDCLGIFSWLRGRCLLSICLQ